ncbi:MAG: FhaA domain-containing protein [Anaerolineae bacterium]
MNDYRLARIEARIAGLVEGAFAQVFGSPSGLQSVVARLSTTLDEADRMASAMGTTQEKRRFVVRMHTAQVDALRAAWPGVEDSLARQLAEQRTLRGELSLPLPDVMLEADELLASDAVVVSAVDPETKRDPTGILPRITIPDARLPKGAILVNGIEEIPLSSAVITLGRAPDCTIVLHDPYASRVHAQIRLRGGRFVVLDAGSHSGTYVNDSPIKEHWLYAGDVIRLGKTVFVYQDQQQPDPTQSTQPMHPLD